MNDIQNEDNDSDSYQVKHKHLDKLAKRSNNLVSVQHTPLKRFQQVNHIKQDEPGNALYLSFDFDGRYIELSGEWQYQTLMMYVTIILGMIPVGLIVLTLVDAPIPYIGATIIPSLLLVGVSFYYGSYKNSSIGKVILDRETGNVMFTKGAYFDEFIVPFSSIQLYSQPRVGSYKKDSYKSYLTSNLLPQNIEDFKHFIFFGMSQAPELIQVEWIQVNLLMDKSMPLPNPDDEIDGEALEDMLSMMFNR